jgi:hypothetical protein
MKVIDLLNKIANGEEVPQKIKWNDLIYEKSKYNATPRGYYYRINGGIKLWLLDEINSLNDEVEIIKEEKKIPEKLIPTSLKGIDNIDEKIEIAHIDTISVIETLNQLIDYLKSKGE